MNGLKILFGLIILSQLFLSFAQKTLIIVQGSVNKMSHDVPRMYLAQGSKLTWENTCTIMP